MSKELEKARTRFMEELREHAIKQKKKNKKAKQKKKQKIVSMGYITEEQSNTLEKLKGTKEDERYSMWEVDKQGDYYPYLEPASLTKKLKPGYYKVKYNGRLESLFAHQVEYRTDELVKLPYDSFNKILSDTKRFWERKQKYLEYGFIHKRGILLYGPPGAGKSCLIQLLVKDLIHKQKGVLFSIDGHQELDYYTQFARDVFREIEPSTPMMTIIEDIDGLCRDTEIESQLLNILDGVNHFDNNITIATTNYLDDLPDRIKNRPSRFDRKYHIGLPNEEVRRAYLEAKIHEEDKKVHNIDEWVKDTDGFALAHSKELIASVIVIGNDYEEAKDELSKSAKNLNSAVYGEERSTGFRRYSQ